MPQHVLPRNLPNDYSYKEDAWKEVLYTYNGYNRATETQKYLEDNSSTTSTYTYDQTNWLTAIDSVYAEPGGNSYSWGTRYEFDANGNITKKADLDYPDYPGVFTYDSRDKLTKVTSGDQEILGQYSYNAQGYRIRQQNSDRGDIDYIYDGTAVIEERKGGNLLAHYRYAGKLCSLSTPQGNQYYHLDALGSTTELTDDQGGVIEYYFLDPWGVLEGGGNESINRRIFTGKEIDQNTGLIYFGARYYDPETARFTTQDSYLGKQDEPPSLHRYLYAYSNPTVYIDLEGYYSWKEFRQDAYQTINKVVDPLGVSNLMIKGLDQVSKGIEYLEQGVDAQYDRQSEGKHQIVKDALAVRATTGRTVLGLAKGLVNTPKSLREQGEKFVSDPSLENIPVLGEQGRAIGESYARAYERRDFVSVSEAIGQTLLGFSTAFGGVQAARGAGLKGTHQAPKTVPRLTGESEAGVLENYSDVPNNVSIGRSGYKSIAEFTDAVTVKYQALYDQGYVIAQKMVAKGRIPNTARAIGSKTDEFARVGLRDWLSNVEGIEEGTKSIIQVNRRLYDPMGSGAYRVPDVYIPGSQTILDGSISFKTGASKQIIDFKRFSGGAKTTIIAPSGLPWGSYGIIP